MAEKEEVVGNFTRETMEEVYNAQNGRCKICVNRIDDFHHKLSNTKSNRKLFPLYVNSIFNCVGLCRGCHDSDAIYNFKVTLGEAAAYEGYLSNALVSGKKGEG